MIAQMAHEVGNLFLTHCSKLISSLRLSIISVRYIVLGPGSHLRFRKKAGVAGGERGGGRHRGRPNSDPPYYGASLPREMFGSYRDSFLSVRALENSKEHLAREVLRSSSPESEYPAARQRDIAEAFVKSKAANEISSPRVDDERGSLSDSRLAMKWDLKRLTCAFGSSKIEDTVLAVSVRLCWWNEREAEKCSRRSSRRFFYRRGRNVRGGAILEASWMFRNRRVARSANIRE